MPQGPVTGEGGEVECEVTGTLEQIDRAVSLMKESIAQSELARRRQALRKRQQLRKPAVRSGGGGEGRGGSQMVALVR